MIELNTDYLLKQVHAQREELVTAFIAKYGIGPDEAMILEKETETGKIWYMERKTIKPKEEKMEDTVVIIKPAKFNLSTYEAHLTLDQAEKVGKESKRIRAEIAKREEIQEGDWVNHDGRLFQANSIEGDAVFGRNRRGYNIKDCKKLHPTPEVKAWLDGVVGGEG